MYRTNSRLILMLDALLALFRYKAGQSVIAAPAASGRSVYPRARSDVRTRLRKRPTELPLLRLQCNRRGCGPPRNAERHGHAIPTRRPVVETANCLAPRTHPTRKSGVPAGAAIRTGKVDSISLPRTAPIRAPTGGAMKCARLFGRGRQSRVEAGEPTLLSQSWTRDFAHRMLAGPLCPRASGATRP
jgi:hypothetical protein